MKKYLGVVLASTLVMSMLFGCSSGSSSSGSAAAGTTAAAAAETKAASEETTAAAPADEGPTGTVTLKVAHNFDFVTIPDAVVEAGERLNKKYEEEGRDLRIEFEKDYQRIDWVDFHNNMIFAEKNGEGADLITLDSDIQGYVQAGMLLDISDLMTDDFVEDVFTPFMVDGKAYGMPFDLPVRVIYYNKSALEKIGWTQEQIDELPQKMADGSFTWEQFLDLCAEVQEKGAVEWGLTHRPGTGNDFLDVLMTLGGEYYTEDGNLVFDSEGLLHFFQDIYDNANVTKITPSNNCQISWTTIEEWTGGGSCFAYYGTMYSVTYVAEAAGKTPDELAESLVFVVFPASQYNDKPFCTAAPQGMGINAHTEYPEICKDLFRELYSGDSVDLMAHHANTIYTLSSVKAANEMDELLQNPLLKEVGYMADLAITPPTINGITTYTDGLHTQIELLELGQTTPEKAVEDFKTHLEISPEADTIVFK